MVMRVGSRREGGGKRGRKRRERQRKTDRLRQRQRQRETNGEKQRFIVETAFEALHIECEGVEEGAIP